MPRQHLGGIHSSCAISGIAWLILMLVNQFKVKYAYNDSLLAFGIITAIVLIITMTAGLPWVRNTHHKYVPHRYDIPRLVADNHLQCLREEPPVLWLDFSCDDLGIHSPDQHLRCHGWEMGSQRCLRCPPASVLVYHGRNPLVRILLTKIHIS